MASFDTIKTSLARAKYMRALIRRADAETARTRREISTTRQLLRHLREENLAAARLAGVIDALGRPDEPCA
ncbi:MAG TPA: hypothetical protein VGU24_16100 [Microvirga sp.]|jgi:hypothetical protein|nr:hypothetical protein [Microvirga sp.]